MEFLSGEMTSQGQVTIPQKLQELLSVKEGKQLRFIVDKNTQSRLNLLKRTY